jgi:hypothetical protein
VAAVVRKFLLVMFIGGSDSIIVEMEVVGVEEFRPRFAIGAERHRVDVNVFHVRRLLAATTDLLVFMWAPSVFTAASRMTAFIFLQPPSFAGNTATVC